MGGGSPKALFWGSRESVQGEAGPKQGLEDGISGSVQGSADRPHLFSRVPCCSRMALVSLWGEELSSGNWLYGRDTAHTPRVDAGCVEFTESSGAIFC